MRNPTLILLVLLFNSGLAGAMSSLAASNNSGRLPNELGMIPIVMYHSIDGPAEFDGGPRYDALGLNLSSATFRHQLHLMYEAGWYPVNMRDILTAQINVPRGKTPVVLTFDDARPSQFRYLPNGSIDPDCAIGILEAFHKSHRDWPRRAAFYVMPESEYNGVPFDQDGMEGKKLRYLVRMGYEVGNHTVAHPNLTNLSPARMRWEMAGCVRGIRRLAPGITMDTMALPYGIAPKNHALWHWLIHGTEGGTTYSNRCILLVGSGPTYPFLHRLFDRTQVPRIEPRPGILERWVRQLQPGSDTPPFVSDGNPNTVTIPSSSRGKLNWSRFEIQHKFQLRVY